MTDFCQRKMSRTRRRIRSCPWRIRSASNENLAIENLEIVFLQVLDSAEEDGFGFGKSRVVRKLFARQLKGADDVGYLERRYLEGSTSGAYSVREEKMEKASLMRLVSADCPLS